MSERSSLWLRELHYASDIPAAYCRDTEFAARLVIDAARARGINLATAESCTGGLLCGALTAIPGSSEVVLGGIVSYSNTVKHKVLGVSQDTLDGVGAVSEACVLQMATGACEVLGAQLVVSVSGIAGPDGGTEFKPVGTVWFGRASVNNANQAPACVAELHQLSGDRAEVRAKSVLVALSLMYEQIVENDNLKK